MNFWEKNIQQRKGHTHQLPDVGPAWNVGERKVHRGVQTEQGERHIVRCGQIIEIWGRWLRISDVILQVMGSKQGVSTAP